MHEKLVSQPILNSQREPIQPGIIPIPYASVYIVQRKRDLLAQRE